MKKLIVFLLLTSGVLAQTTTNWGMNIPTVGTTGWGALINANFTMLDSKLACFGTGTVAGTIVYYNGTTWVCLPGNTSGTRILQQTASGVPSWVVNSAAPLASPTFTGIPAGPTASLGTNTTQLATTAFVLANAGSVTGTANQITVTGTTLSLPSTLVFPGTVAGQTFLVNGSVSGSATLNASSTGGTLNLGSNAATVDASGNATFNCIATTGATCPVGNNINIPAIVAPSSPASGLLSLYEDSTDLRFHDKNAAGTIGTTVVSNTCATGVKAVSAAGVITCTTGITTATNCTAAGTAANPSVVSCSAAPAGAFSCATAASTGTCTVNTTAALTNSDIHVTSTASAGTRLGVTCNTTADAPAGPRIASISNGVSFTINLGTVTTNPACFFYSIVN